MFGTDDGWPSRLLPTPKRWLKGFSLSIAIIVAVLVAKAAYSTPIAARPPVKATGNAHLPEAPASFGRHPIIDLKTVILEGVYVRN